MNIDIQHARTLTSEVQQLYVSDGHISRHIDGAAGRIDAADLIATPGFIDIQINGAWGIDFATEPNRIWEVGRRLPEHGVTTFLPTIVSAPPEIITEALDTLSQRPKGYIGAEPLGLHLEGPYLAASRHGAHDPNLLLAPDDELTEAMTREAGVRMVTIAPELPGSATRIRRLVAAGVTVAAGHSDADSAAVDEAVAAGLTGVTHLFNAMGPIDHRRPGLAVEALSNGALTCSLIADGAHVHPRVVRLAWKSIGKGRLVLVTDAVAACAAPAGRYRLGTRDVVSDGEVVTLEDGTLAGSLLTMPAAIKNFVSYTDCTLVDAFACATSTPARLLGLTDRGTTAPGTRADLVLLDNALQPAITLCAGQIAYVARDHGHRVHP